MAAPIVTMRPVVHWGQFAPNGADVANISNEMAYILGGLSQGTLKAQSFNDWTVYSYNATTGDITNHVYRNRDFWRSVSTEPVISKAATGTAQIYTAAYIPGADNVYVYILHYEQSSSAFLFYQSSTPTGTPTGVGSTLIHSFSIGSGIYIKCYKIARTQDYIFVQNRINATATISILNIHMFRETQAYVFNQVNDKLVWGDPGGNNQPYSWLNTNIPYTPYLGAYLLTPYYYDSNANLLKEMQVVDPNISNADHPKGYSMVFQFNGQHYGPVYVKLWDDDTLSDRLSKMFTEDVTGLWSPADSDTSDVTTTDREQVTLASDTASDVSYLIGMYSKIYSSNTDINPSQAGQESPVINLDYSYV